MKIASDITKVLGIQMQQGENSASTHTFEPITLSAVEWQVVRNSIDTLGSWRDLMSEEFRLPCR